MFYEDLSPYRYSAVPTGLPGVLNIGWLGPGAEIIQGDVDQPALTELRRVAKAPVLLKRGEHRCELCGGFSGNGEIWIPDERGRVYASPSMLLHYIEAHAYLPPAQFLEALRRGPEPLSHDDCGARIATHRLKLETAPTLADILVPYYSTKIFWRREHFADLGALEAFLASELPFQFPSVAVSDLGFFVRTECEDPPGLLRKLVAQLQLSGRTPFQCTFKLVYVGGTEHSYTAETAW